MKIKVCGMTSISNVPEVIEAGADILGFIFYQGSKRYVGKAPDYKLFECIPANIEKAGVFVNERMERVLELAEQYKLNSIQLHGSESPSFCNEVKKHGYTVIKSFGIGSAADLADAETYLQSCDYFLFDTPSPGYGGSGKRFEWEILSSYRHNKAFFLSGGIGPDDADAIGRLKIEPLKFVDLNSRFETSPGIKDPALVRKFISILKSNEL